MGAALAPEEPIERAEVDEVASARALECNDLKQQVGAWIAANPSFEHTYAGAKLKQATCPALPFVYMGRLTDDRFSMNFTRAIHQDDAVEALAKIVEFMCVEHVSIPGLKPPEDWRVEARPQCTSFKDGEGGQCIRFTCFDGKVLRWTIDSKEFCKVRGVHESAQAALRAGRPVAPELLFEVAADFRGVLHFECSVQFDA
mmetsp:Transcript_11374/g.25832  ORF Transcript_11374/g.25832 Transcript_11374/m.25832 type:complete len:200 (+) Transcript_11374:68-667(+)